MASNRAVVSSFLLFSLCCFHLSALPLAAAAAATPEKVRLELYYETLCPYCSRFIVSFLSKIFEDGLISIVDLNLVPYGNARVASDGTITCQVFPFSPRSLLGAPGACKVESLLKSAHQDECAYHTCEAGAPLNSFGSLEGMDSNKN
uniref:GILT-like protein F37H8.5 n=1 Tax=Anthurium amnicola TaxID=1678845 RepID=A0A1D1YAB4_9ARAE